jgi:hypothetical protein
MSQNLWPDFDLGKATPSPKSVIETAGAGLSAKTKGLVTFYALGASIKGNTVEAPFSLWVPALMYHFPFLTAKFAVTPPYPVALVVHEMPDVVAKDEGELTTALAKIFNAPSTVEAITRLAALAQK